MIYSLGGKLHADRHEPAAGSSPTKQSGSPCARGLDESQLGLLVAVILSGVTGHLAELPGCVTVPRASSWREAGGVVRKLVAIKQSAEWPSVHSQLPHCVRSWRSLSSGMSRDMRAGEDFDGMLGMGSGRRPGPSSSEALTSSVVPSRSRSFLASTVTDIRDGAGRRHTTHSPVDGHWRSIEARHPALPFRRSP